MVELIETKTTLKDINGVPLKVHREQIIPKIVEKAMEAEDNYIVARVSAELNVDVDKKQLIRALNADNCIKELCEVLEKYGYAENKEGEKENVESKM